MKFAEQGYHYIGADLPATVSEVEPVARIFANGFDKPEALSYQAVDATNYDSMKAVIDQFDGPVCITIEGLFVYLNDNEIECIAKNIRSILAKKGGCFITPDFSLAAYFIAVYTSLYGIVRGMSLLVKQSRQVEAMSDTSFQDGSHKIIGKGTNDKAAYEFFSNLGFHVERVSFYEGENLSCFECVAPGKLKKLKKKLCKTHGFKMTLQEGFTHVGGQEETVKTGMTFIIEENTLKVSLSGRIDSLNAPEMIDRFKTFSEATTITDIIVDMKDLEYISSAGLRILMMMKKTPDLKSMKAINVGNSVTEILQMTNMHSLFD